MVCLFIHVFLFLQIIKTKNKKKGPEGPYFTLVGRDASRALALHDFNIMESRIDDLKASELSDLDGWIDHYRWKYEEIGNLISDSVPASEKNNTNEIKNTENKETTEKENVSTPTDEEISSANNNKKKNE